MHACKLQMTLEFLEDMSSNVQLHQAVANALSPFIVLKAEVDYPTNMLSQVLWDPSGLRLPLVAEGSTYEQYTLMVTKSVKPSIHDNLYSACLVKRVTP